MTNGGMALHGSSVHAWRCVYRRVLYQYFANYGTAHETCGGHERGMSHEEQMAVERAAHTLLGLSGTRKRQRECCMGVCPDAPATHSGGLRSSEQERRIRRANWTEDERLLLQNACAPWVRRACPRTPEEKWPVDWDQIARSVGTKTKKQCREKFTEELDPRYFSENQPSEFRGWEIAMCRGAATRQYRHAGIISWGEIQTAMWRTGRAKAQYSFRSPRRLRNLWNTMRKKGIW